MEQITFRDWRVGALVDGSGILKLDIESMDGTDILEMGDTGPRASHEGDQYQLHLTTQKIEDRHKLSGRARDDDNHAPEPEEEDGVPAWPIDEDETVYIRGWEVSALVDEDGILNVSVQHGQDNEVYDVEPIESGVPLTSRVVVRLAAEEDNDEDDEDEEDDELDDDYHELDQEDDLDDTYSDDYDDEGDDLDDLYDEDDEAY